MNGSPSAFGHRLRRREDLPLLTGKGVFLADLVTPNMAAMRVIRSTAAHARITRIDVSAIVGDPDCLGVMTEADLPKALGVLPAMDLLATSAPAHQSVIARGTVRYVGEPVAVILATDAYTAEDLADRVTIEYEPLPVVLDVHSASAADAPLLYPAFRSNVVHETSQAVGDPEGAFAAATTILAETFVFQRVIASPMETRGAVACMEAGSGRFVLHSSTQIPQLLRSELARITGLPLERLRVVAPRIGGGFGSKEAVYPEEVLLLLALQKFGRDVYWCEDRVESFGATVHGREETVQLRAALDPDGIVTAVEVDCLADIGAAYALFGNTPGAAMATVRGPYRIPNFRSRCRSLVTNKTPLNVYRGAGYPQATLAMERIMDSAAVATGLDRADIRRRNLLQPNEFPVDRGVTYPGCGRIIFDSGNYPACLESTLEAIDYAGFAARRAQLPASTHLPRLISLGLGLAFVVEMTSGGGGEPARLRLLESGRLQLTSGITPIGQGSETTLAQILGSHLGVSPDTIDVLAGDTDDLSTAPGTFASRGATMGGNAACLAGDAFVRIACAFTAELRGARIQDIVWQQGELVERGRPAEALTLLALLREGALRGLAPLERLDATARFEDDRVAFANACHAAVVEVDRGTGEIRVLDYAVTHDCGRIANPLLVDGQVMGGVLQGLGGCLTEAITYDDAGRPRASGYMDYVLPTAAVAPRFVLHHIETPSPLNPLGMKGAGEAGCSGASAAIVNAIADALSPHAKLPGGSGPFTPPLVRTLLRQAPHACTGQAQAVESSELSPAS